MNPLPNPVSSLVATAGGGGAELCTEAGWRRLACPSCLGQGLHPRGVHAHSHHVLPSHAPACLGKNTIRAVERASLPMTASAVATIFAGQTPPARTLHPNPNSIASSSSSSNSSRPCKHYLPCSSSSKSPPSILIIHSVLHIERRQRPQSSSTQRTNIAAYTTILDLASSSPL